MKHNYKFIHIAFLLCFLGTTWFAKADPDPNFHIYICWGQSNMEGNATVPDSEKKGVDERFQLLYSANDCSNGDRKKGQWYTATPPLARCFHWNNGGFGPIDYFGRTLVEKLDPSIRVGAIVVACGGADIQLFEKDKYQSYLSTAADWLQGYAKEYGGNPYGRIIEMAKIAQKDGVIKGILVHQGETNTGQSNWPTRLKGVYENMLTDLNLKASDVPLLVGEVRYTGPCSSHNNVVRNVPNVIPTAHVISAKDCEASNDEYHFSVNGYKLLGKRYAEKMLELLGDNPVQQNDLSISAYASKENEPGEVEINVKKDNSDIQKIEIYADGKVIASDKSSYTWTNVTSGKHSIWAVGYDSKNKEYTTAKQTVTILEEQKPFNGSPAKIPGKIEAEEFDYGGEGNAYHDEDEENRNGGDRNEGVDMSNTAVGYTQKGEWIEYTVEVEEDGNYIVESRVASGNSASAFTLYMDNQFIIPGADGTPGGFVEVPNTGDWKTFTTVTTKLNKLTKGTHVLKVEITGDYVDIDYFNFKKDDGSNNNNNNNNQEEELLTGVTLGQYVDIKVQNRTVSIYAPKGAHTNRPLMISCHGMNQDIKYQREQTRWEQVADTADFIVAYPSSVGSTWDINGTSDTDFLIAIIEELHKTHKIDLTRVYMSGFSMGGMLTYHCMNSIPDYFAAFAPISGYMGSTVNASTRPVPLIHTHGTSDSVVPFPEKEGWIGAEAYSKKWADHNNAKDKTTYKVENANITKYSGGDCDADVVLAAVPGRDHIPTNDGYHTSREIWRFVSQYTTNCGKTKPDVLVNVKLTHNSEPGEAEISISIENNDVKKVDIYMDGEKIASDKTSFTVTDIEKGNHNIWAIGYDSNNNEYSSNKKEITIFEAQKPFNGTPATIPGKIEAEEFDFGGEGNAYHDNDEENRNGDTRNEGVDMSSTAVGYTQTGEWLEYTVNVETSGTYEVEAKVASGLDGSSFTLYMDDEPIIPSKGNIKVPNTGDWKTFTTVKSDLEKLSKGTHVLKVEITGDWVDLDYLKLNLLKADETNNVFDVNASASNIPDGDYFAYDATGRLIKVVTIQNAYSDELGKGFYILKNVEGKAYPKVVK